MSKNHTTRRALSPAWVLAAGLLLSACGQRGPLYMPQPPAAPSAPAEPASKAGGTNTPSNTPSSPSKAKP